MRIDPILTIAKREYLSRVKTKGFWIATLLLPLAMTALTILPSVIAMKTRASQRLIVVDEVGSFGTALVAELADEEKAEAAATAKVSTKKKSPEPAQFAVELVP